MSEQKGKEYICGIKIYKVCYYWFYSHSLLRCCPMKPFSGKMLQEVCILRSDKFRMYCEINHWVCLCFKGLKAMMNPVPKKLFVLSLWYTTLFEIKPWFCHLPTFCKFLKRFIYKAWFALFCLWFTFFFLNSEFIFLIKQRE